MAFPTTSILDNFNRADEGPPATGWTTSNGSGCDIVSNQLQAASADGAANWSTLFGADQEAFVDIVTEPADTKSINLIVRQATASNYGSTHYEADFTKKTGANDECEIWKYDGSWAQLGATIDLGGEFTTGDQIGLSVNGTTVEIWINGVSKGSRTDSSVTGSGYCGLLIEEDNLPVDDFGGGAIVVGGGPFLKSFTAGLSFSGSTLKQTNKNLSGGVSFSGSVIKQTRKVFSAGLSFAGSTAKKTQKVFNASLSFSVSMFKKVFKVLSGGLSFSGSVGKIKTFVKAFAADLSFSGSMLKQTRKNLSGSLSFSGAMLKKMSKSFGAGLSFSGSAIKRTAKIFTGGLSFSGSLGRIKTFVKSFTAELSFSGGIVKRTNKVFSAGLSFSGGVLKRMTKSFTAGLSFSGSMLKQMTKSFTAGLSFSGSLISALVGASALIVSDARIAVFNTAKSIIAFFTKDDNRDGKF